VNPDVGVPDVTTVASLAGALAADDTLAAVAPAIEVEPGVVEYLGSELDLDHARAPHTETYASLPGVLDPRPISWIDGAAMLVRAEAREEVGLFDDRFFLIWDEVDWCVRATNAGWRLALCPAVLVQHRRSSSFAGSRKGTYYYWRNLYLVCRLHAPSWWRWRWHYLLRCMEYVTRRSVLTSGHSWVTLRGAVDGLRGRVGPGPHERRGRRPTG
jgi:GT2 family glycosyltransferase